MKQLFECDCVQTFRSLDWFYTRISVVKVTLEKSLSYEIYLNSNETHESPFS